MRQDKKRKAQNIAYKQNYKKAIKETKKLLGKKEAVLSMKKAYSTIDKAIKKNIIHKNKGARLKSQVARSIKK